MTLETRKTVILADDHTMFRQSMSRFLVAHGYDVVAEVDNGHEAIKIAKNLKPDLAILDLSMPLLNGIDTARDIQKRSPDTLSILLTMYDDDVSVLEALKAGLRGYVLKSQASEDLLMALRDVRRGSIYLSPGVSNAVVKAYTCKDAQATNVLSDREKQVLQLIAEGYTTKSIASLLTVSVKTAESHRSHIMQRLQLHNVAGLVRYAIRHGMIQA